MLQPAIIQYPHGITAIDTGYVRPGLAAAHLIVEAGRAAFVDVGTNDSVPLLIATLEQLGIARSAVDLLLLTHVHLDHAGGAGVLMRQLPNARAIVHPRGAPHLVDPRRLISASIAVYGESNYRALYGEIAPIPEERIRLARDGERLELAGRRLLILDTPGHALHHCAYLDEAHANVFTGDTFGVSYRELDTAAGAFVVPTTTPTQFDPEQLAASIERILAFNPQAAFLMHYSRVTGLARIGHSLKIQVDELAALARRHAANPGRETAIRAEMRSMWHTRARQHGVTLAAERIDEVLGFDLELNAQGLIAWLARAAQRGARA